MASLIKRVVFISQYLYSFFFTHFIYTLYFYLLIISYLLYYFYLFLPFDSASHHIHAFTPCLLYSFHPLLSLSNYLSMSTSFSYIALSSCLSPCLSLSFPLFFCNITTDVYLIYLSLPLFLFISLSLRRCLLISLSLPLFLFNVPTVVRRTH